MPRPLLTEIIHRLAQAHPAAPAAAYPVEHFINARPLCQPPQLAREELLQRLAAPLSPALQGSVNLLGNVSYEQVRHAYIMLSPRRAGKRTVRTCRSRAGLRLDPGAGREAHRAANININTVLYQVCGGTGC